MNPLCFLKLLCFQHMLLFSPHVAIKNIRWPLLIVLHLKFHFVLFVCLLACFCFVLFFVSCFCLILFCFFCYFRYYKYVQALIKHVRVNFLRYIAFALQEYHYLKISISRFHLIAENQNYVHENKGLSMTCIYVQIFKSDGYVSISAKVIVFCSHNMVF